MQLFLKSNPIFGIGAASFPEIFNLQTGFWKGHSHNLLLELAISYGLPATITIFAIFSSILILSCKIIFFQKSSENILSFDRALWASLFFFLLSQLADIQYFDGKISLIAWIFLAALKKIIETGDKKTLRN